MLGGKWCQILESQVLSVWILQYRLPMLVMEVGKFESVCGLAEQSRTHKRKVVSLSPVSTNVFVSLGKILNLACLVNLSDIWVAVMGDVTI